MVGKLTSGVSVALNVLALIFLIASIALSTSNRQQQEMVNQRQAEINKGNSLIQLNQSLGQALAEAAINNNDTAARDLLASQGITIKPNAGAKAAAESQPSTTK